MSYAEIKNLSFKYSNNNQDTLKNINLSFEKGEIVAILGESGSGKSTLLRILSGFEAPYKGEFKVNNKGIINETNIVPVEKRGIGMVFQDYALFPHMTIEKNIAFGINKLNKKEQKTIISDVLDLVGLEEHRKKYPHELSGGQQQRVALARAMAPSPELILLDEPFSNLDANLQCRIRRELKEILKKANTTAVFVSHDKDDALEIADRVVVMSDGELIQEGKPQDVYDNPKSDYVAQLFGKYCSI